MLSNHQKVVGHVPLGPTYGDTHVIIPQIIYPDSYQPMIALLCTLLKSNKLCAFELGKV